MAEIEEVTRQAAEYQLSDMDRQSILDKVPSVIEGIKGFSKIQDDEIERQRNTFTQIYGHPFGSED